MRSLLKAATGAALGLLLLSAPASAQFLTFVSATGNDANTCFVQAAPCKTLQRAINQTSPGGELRLLTSLTGNGFINKSITVEGGYNTVIGSIAVNSASAIVRFRRLNLNGVNAFADGFNLINAAAIHIEQCSVERYTNDGVHLAASIATELTISNSVSRDNGTSGLFVDGPTSAKLTIENSLFANNVAHGLDVSSKASVTRSVAAGNQGTGMVLGGAGPMTVTDSTASANGDSGFSAGQDLTVESCLGAGNSQGLFASIVSTARFSTCVFTNNTIGVNNGSGGDVLTLGSSLIAGNTTNVNGALTPLPPE